MPLLGFTGLFKRLSIVSPTGGLKSKTTSAPTVCFSNLRFGADGIEYINSIALSDTFSSSIGPWLDSGSAEDVWIEYTITGGDPGTLNGHDPGSGRLQMNADRDFGVTENVMLETHTCTFTLDFWNAAVGGALLESVQYTLRAYVQSP